MGKMDRQGAIKGSTKGSVKGSLKNSLKSSVKNAAVGQTKAPIKGPIKKAVGKTGRDAVASAPQRKDKARAATAAKAATRTGEAMSQRSAKHSVTVLPEGYKPSDTEPFMNDRHKLYFRNKLIAWKEEIVRQNRETLTVLHEDNAQHADLADRATSETDRALELRARDRQRKLINKIDAALSRIEEGTYGYCEDTGEPIGIKRLDARPIATLSLEAQERHERREKVFRED